MIRLGIRLLAALLITLSSITTLPRSTLAHGPSHGQTVSQEARERGEQLTMDFVGLNTRYQLAPGGQRPAIERNLLAAAVTREQELLGLMESDPGAVLRLAIPASVRAGLPASVQQHVEEEVDIEGTFEILHADDDRGGGRYHYHLDTTRGRLTLHFAGAGREDLLTGSRVRVRGVHLQSTLALDSGSSIVPVTSVPSYTFGEQRVLVIPVYFTDKGPASYNYTDVMQKTDAYYRSNTYQRTWLTSTITPTLPINMASTVCDYWQLASLARSAAQAAGYDLTRYNRHVLAHPKTACTWSGLGTLGGNPSTAWLNGVFPQSTVGHELGHNLGAWHSHSLACAGATCTQSEYGDAYDIMGASSSLGHFNAFQKERLGWLNYPPQDTPPVLTVYGSGQYAIDVYEPAGIAAKALKILKSTDPATGRKTWYFVESRSSGKLLLHTGSESSGDSSFLWDLVQDTSTTDWLLDAGQAYHDPAAGVTITALSTGSAGATVRVDFGTLPCVPADPVQALSPADAQWVPLGIAPSFAVTVTNKDSMSCPAATFALQATAPTGWLAMFDKPSLTIAPGASASATLTAYPSSSVATGFYSLPVTSANQSSPSHDASALATVVLVDSLPVALSFDKDPAIYARNQTVVISTLVSAPGGGGAAGVGVTLKIQKPTTKPGATVTVSGTTDAAGRFLYAYKVKSSDPLGAWQVQGTAAKNGIAGSAATSFTVR